MHGHAHEWTRLYSRPMHLLNGVCQQPVMSRLGNGARTRPGGARIRPELLSCTHFSVPGYSRTPRPPVHGIFWHAHYMIASQNNFLASGALDPTK